MSRAAVGMVIDELFADPHLRVRFALDRVETLAELCLRGFDIHPEEFDMFCRTETCLWFLDDETVDRWRH